MTENRVEERSGVYFTVKWYITSFAKPLGLTSDGGVYNCLERYDLLSLGEITVRKNETHVYKLRKVMFAH
jgi:hypothetical protein